MAPLRERLEGQTSLGRVGDPQDLAGPLLLLASDAGRYVTGVVQGGFYQVAQVTGPLGFVVAQLTGRNEFVLTNGAFGEGRRSDG